MADSYIVICQQVIGGGPAMPFEIVYGFDGKTFTDRKKAIDHGFKIRESDDFNIGVVRDGKVVSLDWMDQVVDADADILAEINAQVRP